MTADNGTRKKIRRVGRVAALALAAAGFGFAGEGMPPVSTPAPVPVTPAEENPAAPTAPAEADNPPAARPPDDDMSGLDPDSRRVRDFGPGDRVRGHWLGDDDQPLVPAAIDGEHGESLVVPVDFPAPATAWRGKRLPGKRFYQWSYTGLVTHRLLFGEPSTITGRLEYEVWLPGDLPAGVRVQTRLTLKTKDGLWYEALGRRAVAEPAATATGGGISWEPATALHPGWNRIRVELREEFAEVHPRGHQQRWSRYVLAQIREIGLVAQADRPYRGRVAFDNFTTWNVNDDFRDPPRLLDLDAPADVLEVPQPLEPLSWRFRVNRPALHPFRQREWVVDLAVAGPLADDDDGRTAFDDGRNNSEDDEEEDEAVGAHAGSHSDAHVKAWRLPAYYEQPYQRLRGADGPAVPYRRDGMDYAATVTRAAADRYVPVGRAVWRARYRPPAPGRYLWRLEVRYTSPVSGRTEKIVSPTASFTVRDFPPDAPAAARRGFLRVSRRDPRYFEFSDGTFFFPVGHSFRSPVDGRHAAEILGKHYPAAPRPADRGLRAYEEILPRMAAAGLNVCEVWMASWWLDLEWSPVWNGYHHLQGYHLENADKLDRLLDLARRHGQFIHLTIDNHGKAGQGSDAEWAFSPYREPTPGSRAAEDTLYGAGGLYAAPPGLPRQAAGFFQSPLAREIYRDKLRYIVARWGQDPAVFAWELWSELDLTGNNDRDRNQYAAPYMHAWHEEMADYLRSLDPTGRPITTHYSGNHNIVDWAMAANPAISYLACDAYTDNPNDNLLTMLAETERKARALPRTKPFLITEYGGGALGAPSVETLFAHFFAGLWWGWMSTTAGTPFFWWYEWIVLEDLYPAYRAFSRYIAGEDKRRGPDEPALATAWPRRLEPVDGGSVDGLSSLALADGNVYYVLVNHAGSLTHMARRPADRPVFPGAKLLLGAAGPGPHTVECMDVWTGEITASRADLTADDNGVLTVTIPEFRAMTAVKVRAATPRSRADIAAAGRAWE